MPASRSHNPIAFAAHPSLLTHPLILSHTARPDGISTSAEILLSWVYNPSSGNLGRRFSYSQDGADAQLCTFCFEYSISSCSRGDESDMKSEILETLPTIRTTSLQPSHPTLFTPSPPCLPCHPVYASPPYRYEISMRIQLLLGKACEGWEFVHGHYS
ncbi:hypothetical protein CVT26_007738 [Gymnopilus dilepis]|uniref:Uncharacterized protein n=1 Tax=Gymnopilus dilepis TaxID=231916 RepID=A0A409WLF3_9AGAR|nr:hypothetical protein CVT26_007738 [Gymnopilus dilepis]